MNFVLTLLEKNLFNYLLIIINKFLKRVALILDKDTFTVKD